MDLVFDDLTETERRIHELREEIGYVMLCEILDRNNDRSLARVNFNNAHLAGFLRDDRPPLSRAERPVLPADAEPDDDVNEEEETEEEEDDEGDAEKAPTLADLGRLDSTLPSLELLAKAAMRWIRYTVADNMTGETSRDFKVRVFSHKGHRTLHACRFGVRDLDRDRPARLALVPALPPTPAPPATVQVIQTLPARPDNSPESRAWRALGDGYTNLIGLLQPSYAHLANLQNTTISNQNEQILRLQEVLETLTSEVVKLRVGVAGADQAERVDAGEAKVREELGRQFIAELGTFGRVVAAGKFGMAPELVDLAEIVNGSPELMEAMKNPEVRKLLRDEKTRKELAEMLTIAARTPDAPTTPPPASPPKGPPTAA